MQEEKFMTKEDILTTFVSLSKSQGSYGRLLRDITPDQIEYLETLKFKQPLDLILFIEGSD